MSSNVILFDAIYFIWCNLIYTLLLFKRSMQLPNVYLNFNIFVVSIVSFVNNIKQMYAFLLSKKRLKALLSNIIL